MANPQLQNGYTKIANELLEAICRLNVSGNEMRILLYVIRRTYGFNRKFAEIPLSEISVAIGMRREHIQKALKKLAGRKIIELHTYCGTKSQTISIVKNYEEWTVESCASCLLPKLATVAKNGNTTVAKNGNTTYKEKRKVLKKEEIKNPQGRYGNVFLSDDEIIKLKNDYGESNVEKYIQKIDDYVQSSGKTYADYEATIRKWLEDDNVQKDDFDIEKYKIFINNF